MLELYRDFAENVAAVPVYRGRKSASERFPGAVETFSIEALMPDGKALQSGTSHDLGQNFAKAYDITFVDADGNDQARVHDLVGRFVAHARRLDHGARRRPRPAHSAEDGADRSGFRFRSCAPATTAPSSNATRLGDRLREAGFRVRVDARDEQPGWKYSEWDMRGVPVRIEIGPRDVDARNGRGRPARPRQGRAGPAARAWRWSKLPAMLRELLDDIQASLYAPGERRFWKTTRSATTDRRRISAISAGAAPG